MTAAMRLIPGLLILVVLAMPAYAATPSPDELQIQTLARQQAVAWNRHDAQAYSALFTKDCDVVNVVGWWWHGRRELQSQLTAAFARTFKQSTLAITEVQVRFLTPEIALAHAYWTMAGAHMPPGMPEPRAGIQTLVVTRHDGHWLIAGFQNTLSRPERPFPSKPPAALR